ncbi:MAG: hypothetical protein ACD_27C00047G0002 [uncultured bacterium]|nr:MAG: hypothetical protein ACD_27C00047G0002 [uncultured bacterium]
MSVEDGGKHGVEGDDTDFIGGMILGRNVALTLVNGDLSLEFGFVRSQGTQVLVGIGDRDTGRAIKVGGGELFLAFLIDFDHNRLVIFEFESNLFKTHEEINDIFLKAIEGGKLMGNTIDTDLSGGCSGKSCQHDSAKGVTKGVAEAFI